jgi:uncharacterized SAM-binding protein YcdF (DUF218 family)
VELTASQSKADRRFGKFRLQRRRLLTIVIALAVLFAAATARLLVWPTQGMPDRVDAIIMLAGPGNRLPVALQLARHQRAPVLVVSQGHLGYGGPCPPAMPNVKVICFEPNPSNTLGEAEFASRLAKRFDWHSVVLVTTREQDTRARLMMERCFNGGIYVVTATRSWYDWPYQIAYGWGALFKAVVLKRAC